MDEYSEEIVSVEHGDESISRYLEDERVLCEGELLKSVVLDNINTQLRKLIEEMGEPIKNKRQEMIRCI